MIDATDMADIKASLLNRRKELLALRESQEDSWREMHTPEVEYEERAEKEDLVRGMDRLNDREKTEVEAIDRAIGKIETSGYGECESCGRPIAVARLKAVPWSPLCRDCARQADAAAAVATGSKISGSADSAAISRQWNDAEILEAIYEELSLDGRIDAEELDIDVRDGVVFLAGVLPSETEHQVLKEILADTLDFRSIEDRIRISRQGWERRDRTDDSRRPVRTRREIDTEGESANEETHHALKGGVPLMPPDKFVPEKEE